MHSQCDSPIRGPTQASPRSEPTLTTHPSTTPQCPECGATVQTVDVSESVCSDCDTVITTKPTSTTGRRWNDAKERERRARAGGRVTNLWADRGIGVGVPETETKDASGSSINQTQSRVTSEKPWTHRRKPAEVHLDYALGEIRRMSERFDIPQTEREEAARLYRVARDEHLLTGRSADGFATACLLAAIRRSSRRIPVSETELLEVSRATRSQVRTARGTLGFELGIGIPPMDPRDFVPRTVSELGGPHTVERHALVLLEAWINSDHGSSSGISPRTLAGAAVHAAFDEFSDGDRPPLAELADIVGVAQSTISTRKGDLVRFKEATNQ